MRFSNNILSLTIAENSAGFPIAAIQGFAEFGGRGCAKAIAQSLKSKLQLNKPLPGGLELISVLNESSSVFNELVSGLHKPLSVFNEHSSILKEPSSVFDEHSRVLKKPSSVFDKHSSVSFQNQRFFDVFVLYSSFLLSTLYFLIKTNKLWAVEKK